MGLNAGGVLERPKKGSFVNKVYRNRRVLVEPARKCALSPEEQESITQRNLERGHIWDEKLNQWLVKESQKQ